jgi:predicted RNase H-like nuclease
VTVDVFSSAAALFADAAEFAVLAIDIPIGLSASEPRAVDRAARQFIGPRRSSVFPAPVRAALNATEYADACDLSRNACGKALSKQAFAILPKIREVDHTLRSMPWLQSRVYEVHPEVCFRLLNAAPLDAPKKSADGFALRLALVETVFPHAFTLVRREVSRRIATDDDVADALVALWTAHRISRGTAVTFPESDAPVDSLGLPMRMLA